ncbi:hypothetical protein Y032_0157g3222 [Ancylostoma ceylanicum]|uniref:Uncharacterized protein n=1 Tax=Ancylostoma ceylanicum TaxID=53326 RepID=A0A016SYZ6_9BILA|nr:hypothetical protein Y032_0157g3222 [Ancylostoma ceylanicum]
MQSKRVCSPNLFLSAPKFVSVRSYPFFHVRNAHIGRTRIEMSGESWRSGRFLTLKPCSSDPGKSAGFFLS